MKRYWSAVGVVGLAAAACALLLVAGSTANGATTSNVRLAHAALGVPLPVDIWVDGSPVQENVTYESVTPYVPLAAGGHTVEVKLSGLGTTVISQTVVLVGGVDLTIMGLGVMPDITTTVLADNNQVANKDTLRLVHASPDAGPVDVVVTGTLTSTMVSELTYKEASGYIGGLGTGVVTFTVRPTGEITPVLSFTRTLESDTIHTLFIMGSTNPVLSVQYPLKPVYVLDRQFSFVYLPNVSREYGP